MHTNTPAGAGPVDQLVRPRAWLCELAQEDGATRTQFVEEDPDGLRWNDAGEPSPYRTTPLHARPTPEAVAWALAEEAGEDPGTLIWEGNPPEPWGEVWCRYMPQAERLVKRLFGA